MTGDTVAIYTGAGVADTTVTTSKGFITTNIDNGLASNIGGFAYRTFRGSSTIDNNNEIRGIIWTDASATDFTLNNKAGAKWIASNLAQNACASIKDCQQRKCHFYP